MALARKRRVVSGFFQRPEDAESAAADLRRGGTQARLTDAGTVEDRLYWGRTAAGIVIGAAGGVVVGVIAGLVELAFRIQSWPGVMIAGIICIAAIGAVAGGLLASATAEGRRSSGQSLVVTATVDEAQAEAAERALDERGASVTDRS